MVPPDDRVLAFLRINPGAFCAGCLASGLGLGLPSGFAALDRLRGAPPATVEEGICSACGRHREVVRLRGAD